MPGFWSTIGTETIKYAAWGDSYATVRLVNHGDGAFTAWYETGQRLIAQGASAP